MTTLTPEQEAVGTRRRVSLPVTEVQVMLAHAKLLEDALNERMRGIELTEHRIGELSANAFLIREACEYYVREASRG